MKIKYFIKQIIIKIGDLELPASSYKRNRAVPLPDPSVDFYLRLARG